MIKVNLKILANDIKTPDLSGKVCNQERQFLYKKTAKLLRIDIESIENITITRKSIDARKKGNVCYTYSINVTIDEKIEKSSQFTRNVDRLSGKALIINKPVITFDPIVNSISDKTFSTEPPVVIGAGPAGLFAAYVLALNGLHPIIIEQGERIEERVNHVENFWNASGDPDRYSNVCFGEGGAGTFSDGKLNTMVKDTYGRIDYVKQVFVENGAPEEILYLAKPHIGTDELRNVIINIRNLIIKLGGEFYFNTKMTDMLIRNLQIEGVTVEDTKNSNVKIINCNRLVLANGHSARETYKVLKDKFKLEQKDIAVGLRIQHPQELIDKLQYGEYAVKLPPADYKLKYHSSNGRAVYSFCMCPGGYVVNASTEKGAIVVNGMSNHSRSSGNANSAIVANVTSSDYGSDDVLAGIEFQRKCEQKAYMASDTVAGKGYIPCQRYVDYKTNTASIKAGEIAPVTKGNVIMTDLTDVLPYSIRSSIIEAIDYFDTIMPGFGSDDALLCGVETRTSSPVRIVRDESLQSNIHGVYPCGEGAGYAGGIMSAAVDGIKCAMKIINN